MRVYTLVFNPNKTLSIHAIHLLFRIRLNYLHYRNILNLLDNYQSQITYLCGSLHKHFQRIYETIGICLQYFSFTIISTIQLYSENYSENLALILYLNLICLFKYKMIC